MTHTQHHQELFTAKEIRAIERACKREAKELTQMQYQRYDEIWYTRIRLDATALAHGREAINDIITKMPNLFVRSPHASGIDLVAEWFDFESTSDLIDYLLAYEPRGPVQERYYQRLLDERLFGFSSSHISAESVVDSVPF